EPIGDLRVARNEREDLYAVLMGGECRPARRLSKAVPNDKPRQVLRLASGLDSEPRDRHVPTELFEPAVRLGREECRSFVVGTRAPVVAGHGSFLPCGISARSRA